MSDDQEKRPHIRLAVENDKKTVDKAWAKHEIEWPLRRLAANVMRVSRGAGEPFSVIQQCIDVVKGAQAFYDKCGDWPDDNEVREALDFHDPRLRDYTQPHDEKASAIEDIVEGALRLAAARLLRQDLQERQGEKDLREAIRRLEYYRAEMRAKWEAESRARAPRPAPKRKKPISKPKL